MTHVYLLKPPAMRKIKQFRTKDFVPVFSASDGSHCLQSHNRPNPDNIDTFGSEVYMVYRTFTHATEPVACCTSMAVARALMHKQSAYSIAYTPRDQMPPEAFRRYTTDDRMKEIPEWRKAMDNHRAKRNLKIAKAFRATYRTKRNTSNGVAV